MNIVRIGDGYIIAMGEDTSDRDAYEFVSDWRKAFPGIVGFLVRTGNVTYLGPGELEIPPEISAWIVEHLSASPSDPEPVE